MGCQPGATEILVVVDTDLRIPDEIDLITAEITDPSGDVRTSEARFGVAEPALPRTLGLVHEGGPLGPYDVVVAGLLGGIEVVSRRARVSFVRGEIRVLRHLSLIRTPHSRRPASPISPALLGVARRSGDLRPTQRLVQTGLRFSKNALSPSRASSVPRIAKSCCSR